MGFCRWRIEVLDVKKGMGFVFFVWYVIIVFFEDCSVVSFFLFLFFSFFNVCNFDGFVR